MHVHDRVKNSSWVIEVISLLDGNQTPELKIGKLMKSKKIRRLNLVPEIDLEYLCAMD